MLVLVLICSVEAGAQFVAPGLLIPVVANLPGVNDTFWRSDINVLNVGASDTSIRLQVFPEIIAGVPAFETAITGPIMLAAGQQLTFTNVLQTHFALLNTKGALWIGSTDGSPLVISSRTYTDAEGGGTYGQDVNSVLVNDTAWASGARHDGFYRTNIGIFWPWDMGQGESVQFDIKVYSSAGEEVGSGTLGFTQAGLQQYSLTGFGVDLLFDGYVVFECSDDFSYWYAYASRVDQITGDAVYHIARGYQVAK
jgi:hypothetical protein